MPLKAAEIRASQPRKNAYKMADERGLFLLIQPSGARLWRLKYRFRGYEKKLSLGKYPKIGLAEARERRDEARRLIASGIDPAVARKQAELEAAMSQATTFRVVADEYIEKMACEGKPASTLVKMRWFRDVLEPDIGHRPIAEITPPETLDALRRVERLGHRETAHRLRAFTDRVFRYAIVTLRATASPANILRGALAAPKVTHRAAVLEPRKVGCTSRLRRTNSSPALPPASCVDSRIARTRSLSLRCPSRVPFRPRAASRAPHPSAAARYAGRSGRTVRRNPAYRWQEHCRSGSRIRREG